MRRVLLQVVFCILAAAAASAQPQPIFDPDDFLDPRQHDGAVLAARLVLGAGANLEDHYRPLDQNAGFAHFTTGFYRGHWQFGYKHSEVRGADTNGPAHVQVCACGPLLYFPTALPADATPDAPPPGRTETLDVGFYRQAGELALRTRVWGSHRPIDTVITNPNNNESTRRSGHERSFGIDTDTHLSVGGGNVWGSVFVNHTAGSGTVDNRAQTELAYTQRFPVAAVKQVLFRTTLTAGGISGRGATGLNLVNPAFEAFWHEYVSHANVHLVYSPVWTRSGLDRGTRHQIALFIDRGVVKLFPVH